LRNINNSAVSACLDWVKCTRENGLFGVNYGNRKYYVLPAMTDIEAQQPPTLSPLEQEIRVTFQQAVAHHQAGQLQEAGNLYRAILQIQRDHPGANHNLGVAAVQAQRPAEGLAYFEAALRSDMESERYWLDYIDALILSGQLDVARQKLALGKQHGLQGEAMEALAERMVVCQRIEDQADAAQQHNVKGAQPIPATLQDGKKQPRHAKLAKPPKKVAARHGTEPNAQEISALGLFFGQGRYIEMEAAARKLTAIYPLYGIGWKALGMSLLQQGRSAEALEYFQRAVALLSEDAEAYNLGGILYSLGFSSRSDLRRALELKRITPGITTRQRAVGRTFSEANQLSACSGNQTEFSGVALQSGHYTQ
jgi:tetratricopeptide (TPR) repeat protein